MTSLQEKIADLLDDYYEDIRMIQAKQIMELLEKENIIISNCPFCGKRGTIKTIQYCSHCATKKKK